MQACRTFEEPYLTLLQTVYDDGVTEVNSRTGSAVKVHPGGTSFALDLSDRLLPVPGVRRVFPKSAAAEIAWFISGSRDVTWLRQYAPLWDKFVEDDGVTIEAGYGHRWRHHFGRDQLGLAIQALRDNPSDRRINISAWDPGYDGLGAQGQKNVPCPTNFTLSILEGRLHSSLFIRSSDLFVGLPYDVMGHALLMDAVACELNLFGLGTMHVTMAHPHIYQAHWSMVEHILDVVASFGAEKPLLPGWSITMIEHRPDAYVQFVKELGQAVRQPEYNPKPEVIV